MRLPHARRPRHVGQVVKHHMSRPSAVGSELVAEQREVVADRNCRSRAFVADREYRQRRAASATRDRHQPSGASRTRTLRRRPSAGHQPPASSTPHTNFCAERKRAVGEPPRLFDAPRRGLEASSRPRRSASRTWPTPASVPPARAPPPVRRNAIPPPRARWFAPSGRPAHPRP